MHPSSSNSHSSLQDSALALISGESNLVANLANISALVFISVPNLNWAGFYLWDESAQELVLGPFQGKPACIRIKPDRGVCGKAFTTQSTQRVSDVHQFEGHIACDPESRSELVIPILQNGKCLGVLDLDSPKINRFTIEDQHSLESLVNRVAPILFCSKGPV
jgi:L-methionine (R)-S-oxide reductase